MTRFGYKKVLTMETLGDNIKNCEYAVRGAIPIKAEQIKQDLLAGRGKYPFDSITAFNIGNPLVYAQQPISYNRNVLALLMD